MGDRVGDEIDVELSCRLFENRGLADAGRADEQHRALLLNRNQVLTVLVLCGVRLHGVNDFLFCFLDVHFLLSHTYSRMAQSGTPLSL